MQDSTGDQVFIVRCWDEGNMRNGRPHWRMHIVHLNREVEAHITNPAEIAEFIAAELGDINTNKRDRVRN